LEFDHVTYCGCNITRATARWFWQKNSKWRDYGSVLQNLLSQKQSSSEHNPHILMPTKCCDQFNVSPVRARPHLLEATIKRLRESLKMPSSEAILNGK